MILAAGGGTRYAGSGGHGHKLLADLHGRPVVTWAIEHAVEAAADLHPGGLDQVIVVVGAVDLPLPDGVLKVHNPRWRDGMATSLQAALEVAERRGHGAVTVGLGDQPHIRPEAWCRVAASPSRIAVARYDGSRGHPVHLAAAVWDLLPTTGDQGARSLMAAHPDLVDDVPCPGNPVDIDTVEDLLQWS